MNLSRLSRPWAIGKYTSVPEILESAKSADLRESASEDHAKYDASFLQYVCISRNDIVTVKDLQPNLRYKSQSRQLLIRDWLDAQN